MTEVSIATTREWNGVTVPEAGTFTIDPNHSNVGFVARHMVFTKVRGQFPEVEGTVTLAEDPTESTVDVTIKTATVNTGAPDRDQHLRSGDFFDVENHPEMTYRSTNIRHVGRDEFVVIGDLTIRGVTRPVELAVTFEGAGVNPWGRQVAGISARAEVDREQWGLTWNAALETGGVLVGRKVILELEVQAARA
ncbi:MAG: YceI family protein [Jiangellaceae bacterium]